MSAGSKEEMQNQLNQESTTPNVVKVAIACQGGGIHAAFEVGVLVEILENIQQQKIARQERFRLIGVSGTSAGALNALMVWYGLADKGGKAGSETEAIKKLESFWDGFAAVNVAEKVLNRLSYSAFRARELEIPWLGINAPILNLNPRGAIVEVVTASLPVFGVRKEYYDLEELLNESCPEFESIDWPGQKTRLLVGATDVIHGIETVFDSNFNNKTGPTLDGWREQRPLTLHGVSASGTLPEFLPAQRVGDRCYWDGLYSLNPPIREFWINTPEVPDEIWVLRINPQRATEEPKSNSEIQHRENELMGNLSLNKELDFIRHINGWALEGWLNPGFLGALYPRLGVKLRTIKMKQETADTLQYSSKFNRSGDFIKQLKKEGREVAQGWLNKWLNKKPEEEADFSYPKDAGYD